MPLQKGQGNIRNNVIELMGKVISPARQKAITTIAVKNNISKQEAQFRQAVRIAQNLSRK